MNAYVLILFCTTGLLVWPTFQLVHRRWSKLAKSLFAVFCITLVLLAVPAVMIELTAAGHRLVPAMWLFPFINFTSLAASLCVALTTRKHEAP
jgi:hypothetical protein